MSGTTATTITIKLGEETYELPTSYEAMDVDTYIQLMKKLSDVDQYGNIEALIRILTVLTGIDREQIEQVPLEQLKPIIKDVGFIFNLPDMDEDVEPESRITIGDTTFQLVDYNKAKVGTALFIENLMNNADDRVAIILDVLAAIVRPVDGDGNVEEFDADKVEKRKDYFKEHLTVPQFHTLSFFLKKHVKDYTSDLES